MKMCVFIAISVTESTKISLGQERLMEVKNIKAKIQAGQS